MKNFLLGVLAGAVATAVTWAATDSLPFAGVIGALAFVAVWLVEHLLDRR
ncbi:hypothetical protein [Streptomyces aurantiogriseus]|uniref:Uncharacterized protein n=1 Tax=Streptomyces aurantiogriseus TaxID=66870 RepID=A0A918FNU8_9ACTN|nr:hypothetical protein [Streptomyces aurantiogriseus]GGR61132.1 hypothetical protein GCM10010251_92290 [Streptomyces aurantiogriseus]